MLHHQYPIIICREHHSLSNQLKHEDAWYNLVEFYVHFGSVLFHLQPLITRLAYSIFQDVLVF